MEGWNKEVRRQGIDSGSAGQDRVEVNGRGFHTTVVGDDNEEKDRTTRHCVDMHRATWKVCALSTGCAGLTKRRNSQQQARPLYVEGEPSEILCKWFWSTANIERLKHNPQWFYSKTWPAAKLESITRGVELEAAFGSVQLVINASTPKTREVHRWPWIFCESHFEWQSLNMISIVYQVQNNVFFPRILKKHPTKKKR